MTSMLFPHHPLHSSHLSIFSFICMYVCMYVYIFWGVSFSGSGEVVINASVPTIDQMTHNCLTSEQFANVMNAIFDAIKSPPSKWRLIFKVSDISYHFRAPISPPAPLKHCKVSCLLLKLMCRLFACASMLWRTATNAL